MTAIGRRSSRHCCNEQMLSNPSCSPFSKTYYAHCRSHGQEPHPAIMTKALKHYAELGIDADTLLSDSDWAPIFCALRAAGGLVSLSLWSISGPYPPSLRERSITELRNNIVPPIIRVPRLMRGFLSSLYEALLAGERLTSIEISGIHLSPAMVDTLCQGLREATWVKHLLLPRCAIGDKGLAALLPAVKIMRNLRTLDIAACGISPQGAKRLCEALKSRIIRRATEKWEKSLRGEVPGNPSLSGIYRVNLCENALSDEGASYLAEIVSENEYLKALDLQRNGITTEGARMFLFVVREHPRMVILDLRNNPAIDDNTMQILQQSLDANAIMTTASLENLQQQEGIILRPLNGDDPLADSYHRVALQPDEVPKTKKVKRGFGSAKVDGMGAKPGWNAGTIGKVGTADKMKKQRLEERLLGFAVKTIPKKKQTGIPAQTEKKRKAVTYVSQKRVMPTTRPISKKLSIPTQTLLDERPRRASPKVAWADHAAALQIPAALPNRKKAKKAKRKVRQTAVKEAPSAKSEAEDNMTLPATVKSLELAKEYWMTEYNERRERREQAAFQGLASDVKAASPLQPSSRYTTDMSPAGRYLSSSESVPYEEDEAALLLRRYEAIMRKRRAEASRTASSGPSNKDFSSVLNDDALPETFRFSEMRPLESTPVPPGYFGSTLASYASFRPGGTTPNASAPQSHTYASSTLQSAAETPYPAPYSATFNDPDVRTLRVPLPMDPTLDIGAPPENQHINHPQESDKPRGSERLLAAGHRSVPFVRSLAQDYFGDWTGTASTGRRESLDGENNRSIMSPGEIASAAEVSKRRDGLPTGQLVGSYVADRGPKKEGTPRTGKGNFSGGEKNIESFLGKWDELYPSGFASVETSPIGSSPYGISYEDPYHRFFTGARSPAPAKISGGEYERFPEAPNFMSGQVPEQREATVGELILQKLGSNFAVAPAARQSSEMSRTEAESLSELVDKLEVESRRTPSAELSPGAMLSAHFMDSGELVTGTAAKEIDTSVSIHHDYIAGERASEKRGQVITAERSACDVRSRHWIHQGAD